MTATNLREDFEANMLDGEKLEDCGDAMLSAKSVFEYITQREQQIKLESRQETIDTICEMATTKPFDKWTKEDINSFFSQLGAWERKQATLRSQPQEESE